MTTFIENWKSQRLAEIAPETQPFMAALIAQVLQNLCDADFHTPQLAAALNLSREHLWRKLEKLTGESPRAVLQKWRLRLAEALLLAFPEHPVRDISLAAGIGNPEHFTRAFRAEYGASPRQYRTSRPKAGGDATK